MKHTYSAAHWGIYEVEPRAGADPLLRPLADDPDPTRIGLDQLDPSVKALRIAGPAVRKGWLEGRNRKGRGSDPFVEVDWDTALDLAAGEIERMRAAHGNQAIFGGS